MSETVSFGYREVDASEKAGMVRSVFSGVAGKYDLMNDAMSMGAHRLWKDQFVARVKPRKGEAILDMAGGTGDIAFRLHKAGAAVTVADINPEMLAVGQERAEKQAKRFQEKWQPVFRSEARQTNDSGLAWSEQNAEVLSFADRTFDAYTIAFGIRNVTFIDKALAEAHRVLKFGGRFYCLEFSTCVWPGFAEVYDAYSHRLVPKLGKMLAGDEESYRYLIESIRRFPPMPAFERMIRDAGFVQTKVEPILGGLVAIHSGWKA